MLSDTVIHLGKKYCAIVTIASLISSLSFSFDIPVVNAETTKPSNLLQFTSQNHILGFRSDGVYAASARHVLKTTFLRANLVTPTSDGIRGADASGKVPALSKVTYKNLWNGIDAVYEAEKNSLMKVTYFVDTTKKGVTPDSIRLHYNRPVQINPNGDLEIMFENGMMTEAAPVAWQETTTGRHPVAVSFKILRENIVGFTLGDYLPNVPLVIDPSLTWTTFLGGSGAQEIYEIAVDTSGNVYVSGYSDATWGSPVRAYSSSTDGFVAKLDSSGTLTWNTFLGGSGTEEINGIVVDTSGNVYVGGRSGATWGSPVRAYTSGKDAFAAKLDSSGTLTWNTFLGGSGTDSIFGIALDSSNNVHVGGRSDATWGSPVRAYSSVTDGLVAKLDSSGTLTWHTFLGGSNQDYVNGIAVDTSGNVYVGGRSVATWGSPISAYTSDSDGLVAKLDSSGTLTWHTFLGGSNFDLVEGITVDTIGNVYVSGYSYATWGSPVRAYSLGDDGFVANLDTNGTLMWHTFLGSSGGDQIYGIAIDTSGNVYVDGYSDATWGTPVRAYTSGRDGLVAKLDTNGALIWNTFLGGSGSDTSFGIVVDTSENVYVSAYSNATWGSPVRAYTSGVDAFVAKILDDTTAPTVSTLSPTDNATDVSRTPNLVITFGEAIGKAGTGTVTIKKTSDDSIVENMAVTGSLVTGSGTTTITINPSVTLDYSTEYYVQINAMAFPDASGNFYAGMSSTTAWSFTTEAVPAAADETTTPVVIHRGGGRGSSAPGRGGTAPMIDLKTMQIISTTNSSSPEQQQQHPTQSSSPAVLLLQNQRMKLLTRIEKKIAAALTSSVQKMLESTRDRLLQRINAKIESLLRAGR